MARLSGIYSAVLRSALGSRKLASVSEGAELLYFRLLLALDQNGRANGDAFDVCAHITTARMKAREVDPDAIEARLQELESAGLVERYGVDGDTVLQVVDFYAPKGWKTPEKYPPNPASTPSGAAQSPDGGPPVPSVGTASPPEGDLKQNRTEQNNKPRVRAGQVGSGGEPSRVIPPSGWFDGLEEPFERELGRLVLAPLQEFASNGEELEFVCMANPNLLNPALQQLAKDSIPRQGKLVIRHFRELASNDVTQGTVKGAVKEALRRLDANTRKATQPGAYLKAALRDIAAGKSAAALREVS